MRTNKDNIKFWLLSLTWGVFMTLLGALFYVLMYLTRNIEKQYIVEGRVTIELKKTFGAVSLGGFIYIWKNASDGIIYHEIGHTVQNYYWGPLFIFVVGLPSIIRASLWNVIKKIKPEANYYDIWFESQANTFGKAVFEKIKF